MQWKYLPKTNNKENGIGSCEKKWLEGSKARLLETFDDDKRANLITSRIQVKKL